MTEHMFDTLYEQGTETMALNHSIRAKALRRRNSETNHDVQPPAPDFDAGFRGIPVEATSGEMSHLMRQASGHQPYETGIR